MNGTLRDDESGMAESENRELYEKALASGDWERLTMFWYVSSRTHVWCGYGADMAAPVERVLGRSRICSQREKS